MMRKTALITGASRGIGRACAAALAKDGWDLYLTCLNSVPELEQLADQLESSYHITCRSFVGDIGDSGTVKKLFKSIDSLGLLVNNAGISYIGLLHEMTDEAWQRVISTNLSSVFYTCRQAVPLMLSQKRGRIINISSVWGAYGSSMEAAYSASKGGVNAFTKALAKELAPSNIQVNAVACGAIDTDMNRCFTTEELDALRDEIPADRLGRPEEAADLVLMLTRSPSYLTGQIITLDGGWI